MLAMSYYSMHPNPSAQSFPVPIFKPIRPPDAVPFVVAGDFLAAGQRDLILVRGNTLELHSLDTEALDLVCHGCRTLFAVVLGVQAISIHDSSAAGVLDDLDMDLDGEYDDRQLTLDDAGTHPLTRARWRGSHVLAVVTNRMVVEIMAVVYNRHADMAVVPDQRVAFVTLKEIPLHGRPFTIDYRQLGMHSAVHPTARSLALASMQDTIHLFRFSSTSALLGTAPEADGASDIVQDKVTLGCVVIWHMFYLEPNPVTAASTTVAQSTDLVVVGYRDLEKQAVVALVRTTESVPVSSEAAAAAALNEGTSLPPLAVSVTFMPLDVATFPSIEVAFALPFKPGRFAIVMNGDLCTLSAWDVLNGNIAAVDRRRLPTSGLISGYITVPDRISEFFFLIADNGDMIKCTPTKSTLLKRIPNLRDASLTYLVRDMLDGKSVDVLLARSDAFNWQLLLVMGDSVQEIDVVDILSPVRHAVSWPAAEARTDDGGVLRPPPLVMAANNKLVQVSELVPFILDSSSQEVHDGLQDLLATQDLIALSFSTETRLLRLQDNELVDVSQQITWDLSEPTLAIHAYDSLVAHITSGSICTYATPAATDIPSLSLPINCVESWSPPAGSWIVCATACKDTIAVATCSDTGQSTLALLSMHALGQGPTWISVPFSQTPTCICLVSAGVAVWVGTLDEYLVQYAPGEGMEALWTVSLPDQCIPNAVVAYGPQVLVGTRSGGLVEMLAAEDCEPRVVATLDVGVGPVRLVAMGDSESIPCSLPAESGDVERLSHWAFCDTQLFTLALRTRGEESFILARQIDILCTAATWFVGAALVVDLAGHLQIGRLGAGLVYNKVDTDLFVPRQLLPCLRGQALLACNSSRDKSVIRVFSRDLQASSTYSLDNYLTSWCEWRPDGPQPKIIIGAAKVERDQVTGGLFYVFVFKQGTLELDSSPYRSKLFATGPIRSVVAIDRRTFGFSTGRYVMLYAYEQHSRGLAPVCNTELRSIITCMSIHRDQLAVGTVRDSVVLIRLRTGPSAVAGLSSTSAAFRGMDVIASDPVARHITALVWAHDGKMVVAADRGGCIVGLAQNPKTELASLDPVFLIQTGYSIPVIVPRSPHSLYAVTVSGAMLLVHLDPLRQGCADGIDEDKLARLSEVQEALATRLYLAYRRPQPSQVPVIDWDLVCQYHGGEVNAVRSAIVSVQRTWPG